MSNRANIFESVKTMRVKKTIFDLSHNNLLTCNMGELVPCLCMEVLPGDTFRVRGTCITKFQPLVAPIMHNIDAYIHYFYVPNRLLWSRWEDFITGGADGTLEPSFPRINIKEALAVGDGRLADYLGFPVLQDKMDFLEDATLEVSALPFKAYCKIWNDFFRDQNLEEEIDLSVNEEGLQDENDWYILRKRAWQKDYFTSALPWAQRGPEVTIPIGTTAPVEGLFRATHIDGSSPSGNVSMNGNYMVDGTNHQLQSASNPTGLYANLEGATGITLNALRQLERLQTWLEANARGGARYVEQILMHFAEFVPDARLQRAEFLGAGRFPVSVSEVLQTSNNSEDGTSQSSLGSVGSRYGHAMAIGSANFTKHFVEHGFIIGIYSVRPQTSYFQGMQKYWRRFDKLDYAWPEFAHLGEQEVKQWEIFTTNVGGSLDESTFGYQSRYAEYKYLPDSVHGDFVSNLQYWHLARKFNTPPHLNSTFIHSEPRKDIFAVTDEKEQALLVQFHFSIKAIRCLPKFGTPMLGH
ncbi:major capsid protein [Capybara microvirus Cap1_SP_217]|nr:major capsid protein [Capybara microvirus Cap1_SP_217]